MSPKCYVEWRPVIRPAKLLIYSPMKLCHSISKSPKALVCPITKIILHVCQFFRVSSPVPPNPLTIFSVISFWLQDKIHVSKVRNEFTLPQYSNLSEVGRQAEKIQAWSLISSEIFPDRAQSAYDTLRPGIRPRVVWNERMYILYGGKKTSHPTDTTTIRPASL